jgi:deoxyadenosine/deoxycytidine kinase
MKTSDLFDNQFVSNFLIDQDKIFAENILSLQEYELYQQVHEQTVIPTEKPGLVVYLQAPADVLLQRIQRRGEAMEQNISLAYIERINEAYSQFFHFYDDAPLLIINAAQVDLINDDLAFNSLLNYMLSIQNGRHYFNPSIFSEASL